MEDTTPRLTPPPKPAVLEVSTPKHAVPEVSLVSDSDSIVTWQAQRHNPGIPDTTRQPQSYTKTVRIESVTRQFMQGTARWPQPRPTQEFLRDAPRAVPSQPVDKGGGHSSPLITPRPPASQRLIPADRGYMGGQNTASPPYSSHPVHHDKKYNPRIYSPVAKHSAQEGPQRDSPIEGQVIPSRQRFSPASTVPYPAGVPQGPLPTHVGTVSSAVRNARQDPLNAHMNTIPSAAREVQQKRPVDINGNCSPHTLPHSSNTPQDSVTGDGSSTPHTLLPGTSIGQNNTYRPAYPHVSSNSTARTTTLPPVTSAGQNDILASQSLPHLQQTRLPTNLQGYNHHPQLYGNRDWPSPASSSLPAPATATSPYITQGPEYPLGQAWGHPEGQYSPVVPAARLPHSPGDPVVYRLIEDQKHQITKLTQDLQKIIERQAKEEEENEERKERGTPRARNHRTRTSQKQPVLHLDAATQTQDAEQPAVKTIGVNTDISWPDLIASLQYHQEEKEEEETTNPRHSGGQGLGQEAWLKGIRGGQEPVPSHQYRRRPRDSSESASEINPDDSRRGSESSSSQEWGQVRPKLLPSTVTANANPTRVDAGDGWQVTQDRRHRGTPNTPSPPPAGTTFYHNVLTNINHILEQTSPTQEEECQEQLHYQQQQQQLHHHHHHQQQQQHQQQRQQQAILPSSQGAVARVDSGKGSTPDPQIEAVREQLQNFGISFLDPATLTPRHRPLVDSLYLPGLHNAVSLYQSSISTHIHHPSDATAAKYLTDSQLAAIAAASPAMKKSSGSTDQPGPAPPPSGLPSHQHHRLFCLNGEGENNSGVSMTTRKFLEKYGLQED